MTSNKYKQEDLQVLDESKNINDDLNSSTARKTKIHLVGGEKGGSGKSFFSKAFIEHCELTNLDLIIIDADKSNADILKLYNKHKNVEEALFSDDDKRMKEADIIFESALNGSNVLVNLPAQVFQKLLTWIEYSDLIQIADENNIQFIKWFVCNGDVQSADFFIKSINSLHIPHVFVKNLGLCKRWDFIEAMPEFIKAQNKHKFISMELPEFPYWEKNRIDQLQITFSQALSSDSYLGVVCQSRIMKSFIKPVSLAFENTRLIP